MHGEEWSTNAERYRDIDMHDVLIQERERERESEREQTSKSTNSGARFFASYTAGHPSQRLTLTQSSSSGVTTSGTVVAEPAEVAVAGVAELVAPLTCVVTRMPPPR